MATTSKKKVTKKIIKKNIEQGVAHIKASFNNTIVTIADLYGNVVVTLSAGALKFKGSQKSTGFAAQIVSDACAKRAMEHGMQSVYVEVKGPGMGRESAIRALKLAGLNIFSIKDVTPIPHNGCRPKKKRRV